MSRRATTLTLSFNASGAIAAYRIVELVTDDETVKAANSATDLLFGVGPEIAIADTEPCDVHVGGVAEVEYGGTVARGNLLTSNASGQAIATTTANNRLIGIAMKSGVSGDIGSVLIAPGIV